MKKTETRQFWIMKRHHTPSSDICNPQIFKWQLYAYDVSFEWFLQSIYRNLVLIYCQN